MKNKEYEVKGISKIVQMKNRDLIEFIAVQLYYNVAKSTGDWKIAHDLLIQN